jgi:hypothetical protein
MESTVEKILQESWYMKMNKSLMEGKVLLSENFKNNESHLLVPLKKSSVSQESPTRLCLSACRTPACFSTLSPRVALAL